MAKYGVKEGTLNTTVTEYSKRGEESWMDNRKNNGRTPYTELDSKSNEYIQDKRKLALPVSWSMMQLRAVELSQEPDFVASYRWMKNFLKRNGYSIRKRTTKLKKMNKDYLKEVHKYFEKLKDCRQEECLFINFDESCLPFDLLGEMTIEAKGSKQVQILTHCKEKGTCTISTGITSDGDVILPLVIFKYRYSGNAATKRTCPKKHEVWTKLTTPCMTRFTESGFNNMSIMAEWIVALKRKLALRNETRKVILLLDSAGCHKGSPISSALQGSNIQIVKIPGGCTGFLQPLDTSIFKGLKQNIRRRYMQWLDSKQISLQDPETAQNVLTRGQNLKSPELAEIRDWFSESVKLEKHENISKAFETCGISKEFENPGILNRQLREQWWKMLEYLEQEESKQDPYLSEEESLMKAIVAEGDHVILREECEDDEDNDQLEEAETEEEEFRERMRIILGGEEDEEIEDQEQRKEYKKLLEENFDHHREREDRVGEEEERMVKEKENVEEEIQGIIYDKKELLLECKRKKVQSLTKANKKRNEASRGVRESLQGKNSLSTARPGNTLFTYFKPKD